MNKFRRIAAFAAALCLGAAMFTGCGSSDDDVKDKDVEKAAAQLNDEKSGNSGSGEKQIKDIDPFEGLKVEFKETSPAGKVDISSGHSKVKYKADPEKGLKNGDVVTVTATLNGGYDKEYNLTATEKQYTVEGLDEYIQKTEDIPKEKFDEMDKTFRDGYAKYLENSCSGAKPKIQKIELAGTYMLTKKDTTNPYNNKNQNLLDRIYFVYKINADFEKTGESHEYYWCAYYDNVKKLADGTIEVDLNDLNKGSHQYDNIKVDVFLIDGCNTTDDIYEKNIKQYEEEYDCVSTVK